MKLTEKEINYIFDNFMSKTEVGGEYTKKEYHGIIKLEIEQGRFLTYLEFLIRKVKRKLGLGDEIEY